jgi:hypothetical protein
MRPHAPALGRWLPAVATLAGYAVGVCWLTWPLAAHVRTHLADTSLSCRIDGWHGAWALAWAAHALGTDPSAFFEANIYHPTPNALAYGEMGLGALVLFAPVFSLTGNPALAVNSTFLGGLALTASGVHRVVVRWTGTELAGLVAGSTVLTAPWTLWMWVPTAPYYAALFYLPWIVLLAASRGGGWRRTTALAALVALQSLTDPVYVAPATWAPLLVLAAARLRRGDDRRDGTRLLAALALSGLLLAPVYRAHVAVLQREPDPAAQSVWRVPPERLAALGVPVVAGIPMHPQPAPWSGTMNAGPLGVAPIVLVLIGMGALLQLASRPADGRAPSTRTWVHAGVWAATGVAISVPAVGTIGDAVVMPHFALAARVAPDLLQIVRSPWRLGVAALIGLALLGGLAFARCAHALSRRARGAPLLLATLVVGLAVLECRRHVPAAYPVAPAMRGDGPILEALRRGAGPLLELPVPDAGGAPFLHTRAMYRSIFHWRPLLNGYGSYFPARFPDLMRLASNLPDADALAALRRETGLATILVHLRPGLPNLGAWREAANDAGAEGLVLVAREGDEAVFDLPE